MIKKHKLFILLIITVFISTASASDDDERPMSLREAAVFYANVVRHVLTNYVNNISIEKLLEGALRGMLTAVDQYSDYLTPKQFFELREQTADKYGGIGIEVTMDNGMIRIISPIDDTPAFKAGLKPGDIITAINDKPVFGMNMRDLVDNLKGEADKHSTQRCSQL